MEKLKGSFFDKLISRKLEKVTVPFSKGKENVVMKKDLELLKEIGERITNIRISMKLNKEELARELGITGQFLGVVESGKSSLAYDKLKKLCKISGYSADYILFGKNTEAIKETKDLLEKYNQYDIEEMCEIIKSIAIMIRRKDEIDEVKKDDKIS